MDIANNEIVVANLWGDFITVYSRTANGDVAPVRKISGADTGLLDPGGIAVNTVNDEIAVANWSNNSITVYSRTSSGNVAPIRKISGTNTGLYYPWGIALLP